MGGTGEALGFNTIGCLGANALSWDQEFDVLAGLVFAHVWVAASMDLLLVMLG